MSELFHTSNTTIAIFLAIIVAIVVWVVLEKTTFGYELKAVWPEQERRALCRYQ